MNISSRSSIPSNGQHCAGARQRAVLVTKVEPIDSLPEHLRWPCAVGRLLLDFSTLDYALVVFLKKRLKSCEFRKMCKQALHDRVERIGQYLTEINAPTEDQEAYADFTRRLQPIRWIRNHLAHSHLYVCIPEPGSHPALTMAQAIDADRAYRPDARRVTLPELIEASQELSRLIEIALRIAGFRDGGEQTTPASSQSANAGRQGDLTSETAGPRVGGSAAPPVQTTVLNS